MWQHFETPQGTFGWEGGQAVKQGFKHSSCCSHPQDFSCSCTTVWLLSSLSSAGEMDRRLVGCVDGWLPTQSPPVQHLWAVLSLCLYSLSKEKDICHQEAVFNSSIGVSWDCFWGQKLGGVSGKQGWREWEETDFKSFEKYQFSLIMPRKSNLPEEK